MLLLWLTTALSPQSMAIGQQIIGIMMVTAPSTATMHSMIAPLMDE